MRDNLAPPTYTPISPGGIEFGDLTPEQSANTQAMLELIANTYNTPYAVVLLDQHTLTRNIYEQEWDPQKGKKVNRIVDGQKVVLKAKGVDMCNPVIYDCCIGNELYGNHTYIYGKPGHNDRPSLAEIVLSSSKTQCYLYYPTLMFQRPPIRQCPEWDPKQQTLVTKTKWASYDTSDIAAARCIWIDVDGHHLDDRIVHDCNLAAIDQLLRILPAYCAKTNIPMPAIVNSGRGVHLYWWLSRIAPLETDEQQYTFRMMLYKMGQWIAKLIEADPLCGKVWEVDRAAHSLLRMLHLPGCVHPKLGVRRYAVNALGRDYNLCNYTDLVSAIDAIDVADALRAKAPVCNSQVSEIPKPEAPTPINPAPVSANAIPPTPTMDPDDSIAVAPAAEDCDTALDSALVQDTVADTNSQPRVSRRRLDRLLDWAEGRKWELTSVRELFLFCCAVLMQHMGTKNISRELQHINAKLCNPLTDAELAKIVPSLDRKAAYSDLPYVGYYIPSNNWIADKLHMTPTETKRFCSTPRSTSTHKTTTFRSKFHEFLEILPRDPSKETVVEHRNRVYQHTRDWFRKEFEGYDRNTARQRRRSQNPQYNSKAGRYKKVTPETEQKCLTLHADGLSERKIAVHLQISKSAVHRIIAGDGPKLEE